jgi:Ca2+-binding EF-hand superfamily protein
MSQLSVSGECIDTAVRRLFDTYDKNKDGKLSINELEPLFGSTLKSIGKDRRPCAA